MKNLKKKIEVFCLVMMMCVMSIVPNMNVNAAATCTRTEPTEAQITAHDPIIYGSSVLGTVTASGVVDNLGSISSYDDFNMPEGMAYVVPYGYKNSNTVTCWDYCGGAYAGTSTEVYVYNDATRKTSNATRISAFPDYQQKIDTLSNELKYKINTYGMFIRCIAVADDYTDWDDNPKTNYNGTVTCRANFSAYIEAYPDAYIDTKLSDTNTIIEGANGSLDGTAAFPCANEYKHYEWQVAPADAYTDVTAANADKTDDKWTSCSGATYASAGGSVMTIMNTPKSLNNKYYRCKYDTGLKGAVASYSNVTQLKVTDAELTGVTAKSFGTNSSKYKPNVGDTVSTDDITVTTKWNNNNVIDKDGNDALVKGKLFFVDKNGKEASKYSFDTIGAGAVDVVYDPEGSVGKTPSVKDAYKSTLSFTVEDLTAPKAEPTVNNTVKTDVSKTTDITINASDNYDKAADIQYKLVKYQSDDKTYDMVQDFAKVGTGVYKLAAKNGNGKYGLIMKDSFGNISNPYTFTVEAWDNTAPVLDIAITPDVSKPSTYRTIKFNASDGDASNTNIVNNKFKYFAELETSSYKEKAYSAITDWSTTDGYTITKEGTYHLYCADKYGNMTTSKIDASKLNLDNEAPIIDSLSLTGENSSAFNVSTNAATKDEIHITAHDNKTATADILFKLQKQNGSKYEDVTNYGTYQKLSKYTLTGTQGNGIYRVIAKDSFDNISDPVTISVYAWDDMTPAISSAITPDVSKPSTYRTIKFNASDGDASNTNIVNNKFKYFMEAETTGYTIKQFSDIQDWSNTDGFTITKEGTYHLYCADKYGNMIESQLNTLPLNLDNEPPTVSASVSNPDENDNVTVTLKAKDNVTAITKGCISINPNDVTLSDGAKDGDWTIYTFATKNMNDYTVKVSDDAGNSTDVVISAGQALSQTFTVKFLSEDGQVLKTENVVYGHSATPPTVEGKEGYTFNGWTGSFQNVTSNISLYARFTKDPIKYVTVHYNTDGGNTIQDAQVESGSRAPYQKPIKSGYFFNGWYTDSNKGVLYDFGQGVTSETTIYASWSVDKANKLTNAELQDLLDKAKSSVTAQTKTVTVTKTEVKTVAAKDDPNVHKYTDAELQKLLEEARAAGYKEGSASVKPEKIYIKAQAKAKDNTVTVSEDPRADVDDGNLVSVKFSLPEGRTFTKKLAPGTPIVVLDTDGQHIKDYKAENGLIIDLSNDSDDDLKGYNAYDLNDEYVLKQTCIEDEDTALADGNESLNTETVTEEDDNDKTSSVNMKTIGIISGISLAGIGLICLVILMLKRKKKNK